MPLIQITILEGRSLTQKHRLLREVTALVSEILESPKERVRVCIYEVNPDCWGIAGEPASVVRAAEIAARAAAAKKKAAPKPKAKKRA